MLELFERRFQNHPFKPHFAIILTGLRPLLRQEARLGLFIVVISLLYLPLQFFGRPGCPRSSLAPLSFRLRRRVFIESRSRLCKQFALGSGTRVRVIVLLLEES